MKITLTYLIGFITILNLTSCRKQEDLSRIVIWHQMRVDEREILEAQLQRYMHLNPDVKVEALYKETEELRSGFIIAAIAGQGPDLVYGPSDQVGPFQVMDIILPLDTLFEKEFLGRFNPKALVYYKGHLYQIGDKLGNHLTLVYNKSIVKTPPQTDIELIELGQKITVDENRDGKPERYGLVWNYTEPFFFIPFLSGFGGWVMDEEGNPTLDTPANVDALNFIKDLRDKYKIVPGEADYNIADVLFKDGKAGMIINGDWSWAGYKKAGIDIGIAPLPKITKTGLWCAPMVSSKGYSINSNVKKEKLPRIIDLLKFLLAPEQQLEVTKKVNTMPTLIELYEDPFIKNDEIMVNSQLQIERGKPMPVVPELRAIWDAMRPSYQAVLGGAKSPAQAAKDMQQLALRKIKEMNE
ncbi:MAG: Maltose/maltodextrin ABC transporter, substrate binding periplasmic protein MalE [Ignavibacteriae bacterium]|nr:MAG: Maltose/maltodextrin ABC transporter, substrate binding periplasmic protein MalE [Ignavibacteriota bacterium]